MSQQHLGLTIAGKYQLKKLLGEGGMGAVYEGIHLEIGKRVAIKTISLQRAGSGEFASRFRREARAASAIESENIVQVFDVGHDPQIGLYMVMEHLTGEDLSARLQREKKLAPAVAMQLFAQVLHGLEKAHAAGIVHRDLKPANIFLVDRGGRQPLVKILDFGISKFVRDESAVAENNPSLVTRAGAVMGTALYMSPEQAQGAGQVDQRSDIWSLGAVLYEALAGRTPYAPAPSYEGMIVKIVTTLPTPLLEVAPDVPPPLAAVVHQALKHALEERLPDCATFLRLLDGAMPGAVGDWLGRPSAASVPDAMLTTGAGPLPPLSRPLTPAVASRPAFEARPSTPRLSPAALTTGAGGVMVTGGRPSAPSDVPAAAPHTTTRAMPLLVGAAVTVVVLLGLIGSVFLTRGAPATSTAAAVTAPAASSAAPPVPVVAPAPPPAPAPSALPAAAPSVAPAVSAASPARPTRHGSKPAPSAAAAPAPPAAPSATAPSRQFGGVDVSESL